MCLDADGLEATANELEAEVKALRQRASELRRDRARRLNEGLGKISMPGGWHNSIGLRYDSTAGTPLFTLCMKGTDYNWEMNPQKVRELGCMCEQLLKNLEENSNGQET